MVDKNLHSLSTGCVSIKDNDRVNCDDAECIGASISKEVRWYTIYRSENKEKESYHHSWHIDTQSFGCGHQRFCKCKSLFLFLVPYSKQRFLSNNHNKSQLISLLKNAFQTDGQTVKVCRGDADAMIVKEALNSGMGSNVVVVADDTDVAIMLLYHWKDTKKHQFDIFLL